MRELDKNEIIQFTQAANRIVPPEEQEKLHDGIKTYLPGFASYLQSRVENPCSVVLAEFDEAEKKLTYIVGSLAPFSYNPSVLIADVETWYSNCGRGIIAMNHFEHWAYSQRATYISAGVDETNTKAMKKMGFEPHQVNLMRKLI